MLTTQTRSLRKKWRDTVLLSLHMLRCNLCVRMFLKKDESAGAQLAMCAFWLRTSDFLAAVS